MQIRSPLLSVSLPDRHISPTPNSVIRMLAVCRPVGRFFSCAHTISGVKNATRLIMNPAFEAVVYLQPSTMQKYEIKRNVPSTNACRVVSLSTDL